MYRSHFRQALGWGHAVARLCAICIASCMGTYTLAATAQTAVRVMPLGDSLTFGLFNPVLPGQPSLSYRKALLDQLRAAGMTIDYVGPNRDENDPNGLAHAGFTGRTTGDLLTLAPWKAHRPDIVLLMAGTNDFRMMTVGTSLASLGTVAAGGGIGSLVRQIRNDSVQMDQPVQILVASIPPMGYPRSILEPSSGLVQVHDFLDAMVSSIPRPVDRRTFVQAYANLLVAYGLAPDMDTIYAQADTDGTPGLSDTELGVALRWLTEYILNKYIRDYNRNVAALTAQYSNVHFVDAGSALGLEDFIDGTHPATQQAYDKMAPVWFQALTTVIPKSERYWVGGDGAWADAANWSLTPEGPGGAGEPHTGTAHLLRDDGRGGIVTRAADAGPANLSRLEVDGNMTLRLQKDIFALSLLAGNAGSGHIEHTPASPAVTTAPSVILGVQGSGLYEMGAAPGILRSAFQQIGYNGSGTFTQWGGSNEVRRQLILGLAGGKANSTYTLMDGALSANLESIGVTGGGVFNQYGGSNSVVGEPTPGGDSGTLHIVGGNGRPGNPSRVAFYSILDGTLSAVRIVNRGTFRYLGGIVSARFYNDGRLHVLGARELAGDLTQPQYGRLYLDDALGENATSLHVTGTASIDGPIHVDPEPFGTPEAGASFDVLTATHGIDDSLLDQVVLPWLPGTNILRASIAGNALRITVDTVDCEDVQMVRRALGQTGANLPADVNRDGVVNVRDLAAMAKKLPAGTACPR